MAAETTGSTVPRRQLGRYLRELRNRERLTVKVAAEKLEWSEAKIWRIETGQTSRDKLVLSGQRTVTTGEVVGIYLFRRNEAARSVEPLSLNSQYPPATSDCGLK